MYSLNRYKIGCEINRIEKKTLAPVVLRYSHIFLKEEKKRSSHLLTHRVASHGHKKEIDLPVVVIYKIKKKNFVYSFLFFIMMKDGSRKNKCMTNLFSPV